jgi:hypothetical protein
MFMKDIKQNLDASEYQTFNDLKKIQPWSEDFSPKDYLKVVHRDTSLRDLDQLINRLK